MREFVLLKRVFGLIIKIVMGLAEGLLRLLILLLPLGLFMLLVQLRTKAPSGVALPAYINNSKSEWQFVYAGTILVMLEPNALRDKFNSYVSAFNRFVTKYKFLLIFWALVLFTLLVLKVVF